MKARKSERGEPEYEVIAISGRNWKHARKDGKKGFIRGQSWDLTTFAPMFNRKTEGSFVDTYHSFLAVRSFRRQLQELRQGMLSKPAGNWDQAIKWLCEEFELTGAEEWIKWLIQHWDPSASAPPPWHATLHPRSFYPWTIELQSQSEDPTGPKVPRRAVVTFQAGVSSREAARAAAYAVDLLCAAQTSKQGRPGLTEIDRLALHAEFEKYGSPQPQLRQAIIRKAVHAMKKYNRLMSLTIVGKEYRRWLKDKGYPVKRYVTEKRES